MFDRADPYVIFSVDTPGIGGKKAQTSEKKDDLQPNWTGEVLQLKGLGKNPEALTLVVKVYDDDSGSLRGRDDLIGEAKVQMGTFVKGHGNLKLKVDNNIIFKDVYLAMDYETSGWGK